MRRFFLKETVIYMIVIVILMYMFYYNYLKPDLSNRLEQILKYSSKYIVNSTSCQILNLNLFDRSVFQFIKKIERTECAKYPPLSKVAYSIYEEIHILEVDYSALPYYTNSSDVTCCVKRLSDNVINSILVPCQVFYNAFIIDEESKFMLVSCIDEAGEEIYQNIHSATVKIKKFSRRKKEKQERQNKLNILLIGIDSMSRLNFYRTMMKTSFYLHTHGWVEMKGYNKIADNTLHNIMAFLTGLPPKNFKRANILDLDGIPFIWKELSSAGYVTAYAEDKPEVSTFHRHLRGFNYPPTDHYFKDYIYMGELLFMGNGRPPGCIAYKSSTEHLFDYLLDFVTVYMKDPFFGLFWLNQISNNNLNRASGEDDHVFELLEKLRTLGIMDTTMVVLMSDHGLRVGDFRKSKHGWYEDRLPLLFISIPEWYKTQNDLHYLNLLKNSERLTSPYDLYMTIKHVLYGETNKSSSVAGCKTCRSLFTEVPSDRSCPEAGVSSHWCTCHPSTDVPYDEFMDIIADHVVQAINEKLSSDPDIDPYFVCEQLKLKNVLYVRQKYNKTVNEFIVGVATDPGGAEFEGTVVVHQNFIKVEDSISRLNDYGSESSCAENPISKLFCYCKQIQSNSLQNVKSILKH